MWGFLFLVLMTAVTMTTPEEKGLVVRILRNLLDLVLTSSRTQECQHTRQDGGGPHAASPGLVLVTEALVSTETTFTDGDSQRVGAAERRTATIRNHHWKEQDGLILTQEQGLRRQNGGGVVCERKDRM